VPQGYPSHGPASPAPRAVSSGPAASAPPARTAKSQPGPLVGGIALGLGIVLLIIGAAAQVAIIVIGGLVAGAWGMWRLVTAAGNKSKPPGPP